MAVHCTVGVARTSTVGEFPGFEHDYNWIYPSSISNILSVVLIRNRYRVTYEISLKGTPSIMVHLSNYRKMQFVESYQGLYYYYMAPLIFKPVTVGSVICTNIHSGS